jgi:MFS family permease
MATPRVVLATATAAQSAVSLTGFGLPSIGPELQDEFGIGLGVLGAVLTANLLGAGLFLIAAGIAVDRFGSRRLTAAGTALGTAALLAAAFAPTAGILIAALFLTGVGSAVVPIAGMGAVFRAYPMSRRAWALGVRQMGVPLGGVTAALILPPLAHAGDARLALLFAAAALATFGTAFAVSGDRAHGAAGARLRPAVGRILRLPGMGRLLVVAAFYIVVLQSALAYVVPAARDAGLSAFAAGATFFVLQVTAGAARIAWGRIADAGGGARRMRSLAETGGLAALGALAFALALHGGAAAVIPATILFSFGALGWNALVYVSAGERAPLELAAQAVSVAATLIFVLSAFSTPAMGVLAEQVGWNAFWAVCAALSVCGAAVAASLRGQRGQTETRPYVVD